MVLAGGNDGVPQTVVAILIGGGFRDFGIFTPEIRDDSHFDSYFQMAC